MRIYRTLERLAFIVSVGYMHKQVNQRGMCTVHVGCGTVQELDRLAYPPSLSCVGERAGGLQ